MATTYDFPTHVKGDTMEAVTFTITVNAAALDLTGASAKMDVRDGHGSKLTRYTTAVDGGLTIVSPATNGVLRFDEKIVDIEAGSNTYDIEFTLASGEVKTYISGTFTVTQDQTHD